MANDVKATIGLDTKPLQQGLKKSEGMVSRFAGSMKSSIGGAIAAIGFKSLVMESINLGSALSDMAFRTSTTVEEFQALRDAARDAGVEQSVLERGLRNVQLRAQEAVDGNKKYAEALGRLNINAKEFAQLSTAEKFEKIAKSIQGASNESEAFADAAQILGQRAGPQLKEVLNRVATEGLDPMISKLKEAGAIMDNDTAQKLDAAADKIQMLKDRIVIFIGRGITPMMNAWALMSSAIETYMTAYVGTVLKGFQKMTEGAAGLIELLGGDEIAAKMKDFAKNTGQFADASFETAKEGAEETRKAWEKLINNEGDAATATRKRSQVQIDSNNEVTESIEKTNKALEKQKTLQDVLDQDAPSGRRQEGESREDAKARRKERLKIINQKKLAREYQELEKKTQSLKRAGLEGFTGESSTNLGGGGIDQQNIGYGTKGRMRDIAKELGIDTSGMSKSKIKDKLDEAKTAQSGGAGGKDPLAQIAENTKKTAELIEELT